MVKIKWQEIKIGKLSSFTSSLGPDFKTHYNYVHYLKNLSKELLIAENYNFKKTKIEFPKALLKKTRLIRIFKKSIDEEYKGISECHDLSVIGNIWIATKSYYLLFHMWSIVNYLINFEIKSLENSHKKISKFIKEEVSKKHLIFSNDEFNKLYSYEEIAGMEGVPGANLRGNYDKEKMKCCILKKIAKSKIEELKFTKKINDFRKKKNKKIKLDFESKEKNNLVDFFYMDRIKNHYRDLDFLEKNNSSELHFEYYENYFNLTNNFYVALKKLINSLSKKRFNDKLMN